MDENIDKLERVSCDLEQVGHLLNVFLQCTADKLKTDIEKGSTAEADIATLLCRNMQFYSTLLEIASDKVNKQKDDVDCIISTILAG